MGNCIRLESKMQWGGENWESALSTKSKLEMDVDEEERSGAGRAGHVRKKGFGAQGITTEVKVRITKKQLEKLLGKVDMQGLSVKQVLDELMMMSSKFETREVRSWRPRLQRIPEV